MRNLILCVIVFIGFKGAALEDFGKMPFLYSNPLSIQMNQKFSKRDKDNKYFNIEFDWMLETKTELINGIWYSPIIEFNLKTQKGFNLQLQTGALPMLKGYQLYKTNPTAGIALGYSF